MIRPPDPEHGENVFKANVETGGKQWTGNMFVAKNETLQSTTDFIDPQ